VKEAIVALLSSRKFAVAAFAATIIIAVVVAVTVLVAVKVMPVDEYVSTLQTLVTMFTGLAATLIGGLAYEGKALPKAPPAAPVVTETKDPES
jgi:hypothetical protein